ncbi:hypothetical protein [Shewanella sp. 10N.286.48.B5]|uniref:hypothetical protein n=1 Tax=Shewanella sp. 10N.286.48.B5 TaxID=1880834 RepID=UPI000C84DD07|nr:hypothetical protein [Shewanella sp. 10N.286.48.B5]PMH87874.1 hypothetical protein BCU57_05345 [Shewanella sp. 10N.286.48.B5]
MSYKWIIVLIALLLTSCGYKGDGEYIKDGTWPFVNYKLDFPSFSFTSNYENTFKVNGYGSHGSSYLIVKLISEAPLSFEELNTILEVRVSNGDEVYFYRNTPLNSHYLRMVSLADGSWATELEWNGRYNYSAQEIKNRAVPFSPTMKPEQSTEMVYMQSLPTEASEFKVFVKVGSVPSKFNNIKVRISLVSGWK